MTHIVSLTFELSHVVCWISEIKELTCDTIFVNNLLMNINYVELLNLRQIKVTFYLLSNPSFAFVISDS